MIWPTGVRSSLAACAQRVCNPGTFCTTPMVTGCSLVGLCIHLGADALGLTTVPISGGMTPRQVRLIEDFKPKGITVTPSYALSVLDEYAAQGLDPRDLLT